MWGTIILITPILLFGIIWVSYVIATKIYQCFAAKNDTLATTVRVLTFIIGVPIISMMVSFLLFMLFISQIK